MSQEKFIESSWTPQLPQWTGQDEKLETTLRPQSLTEFLGQEAVRERLGILMHAAQTRKEPLGHILFHGPPGVGKTTLAHLISKTMGSHLTITSGPVIDKAGDLAGLLTNLKEGDILFIDEIHRLSKTIEEYLYPAMEDFSLDLLIDSGPASRSVQVKLNRFTLVGATTRVGLLSSPLRSRFMFTSRLDYYEPAILEKILLRSSKLLGVSVTSEAAHEIALRSRGTPRIANNLLRWVRDFALSRKACQIDLLLAQSALEMLSIDHRGLDEMDKKLLSIMIDHHAGGPVGVQTLAVAIGEETETLAEVYEPYLILQGFLKRTPRGREATRLAYIHLGRPLPSKFNQGE
ncbi:MAG: Holliday junction branch migration DNA helicase RuvB [Rhabdochlamydiaceae bacterium]